MFQYNYVLSLSILFFFGWEVLVNSQSKQAELYIVTDKHISNFYKISS